MKKLLFTLSVVAAISIAAISQSKHEAISAQPLDRIDYSVPNTDPVLFPPKDPTVISSQVVVLKFQQGGYATGSGTNYVYHYHELPVVVASTSPGVDPLPEMTVPQIKEVTTLAERLAHYFDSGFQVLHWGSDYVVLGRSIR